MAGSTRSWNPKFFNAGGPTGGLLCAGAVGGPGWSAETTWVAGGVRATAIEWAGRPGPDPGGPHTLGPVFQHVWSLLFPLPRANPPTGHGIE